jgi:hypothetical protein
LKVIDIPWFPERSDSSGGRLKVLPFNGRNRAITWPGMVSKAFSGQLLHACLRSLALL